MAQVVFDLSAITGNPVVEISLQQNGAILVSSDRNDLGAIIANATVVEKYNLWKTIKVAIKADKATWYQTVIAPILTQSNTPLVWVRFGMKSGTTVTYMRPWEQMLLFSPSRIPDQLAVNGGLISLELVDQLYLFDRISKTTIRKGTLPAIVQQILTENATSAFTPSQPVVESSSNSVATSWIQSNQTDYDFLISRLSKYFVGQSGSGDYRLYCRDNQIHFHTIAYTGQKPYVYDVKYSQFGNLSKLEFRDNFYRLMLDGGAGVEAIAVDPISGKVTGVTDNPDGSPLQASGERPVLPEALTLVLMHTGPNQLVDVNGRAQSLYDSKRSNYFSVTFAVGNNPLIQVGDMVNITLSPSSNSDQANGNYTVTSVHHEIGLTASSVVVATRGQLNTSTGSTGVIYSPGQQVLPNQGAPGQVIRPALPNESGNVQVLDPNSA